MKRAAIRLSKLDVKVLIEVELREKRAVAPHKTIDLEPIGEYLELSICMTGKERIAGRWRESVCGQGKDFVLEHFGSDPRVVALCGLWDSWHLNGMRAGQRQQEALLATKREAIAEISKETGVDWFSIATELLNMTGRNPMHGYVYGSAWLVEPLPTIVTERLEWLVTELGGKFAEDSVPENAGLSLTGTVN